ncbi:hypothetical protein FRC08_017915, partial [Ceratobasidium sp. 394]
VRHYLNEERKWINVQATTSFKDGQLTYVFTHDPKTSQGDKPLVRIANDKGKETEDRPAHSKRSCLICLPVIGGYYQTKRDVIDHVRHVHLVQNPKKDVHYR